MSIREYIGARYVPLFAEPIAWDSTAEYEPLTIVLHNGNSYTSRQFVPADIDIENEEYWAITGNYNAQVEMYRRETKRVADDLAVVESIIPASDFSVNNTVKMAIDNNTENISNITNLINSIIITPEQYGAVGDGVTDDTTAFTTMFNAITETTANKTIMCNPNAEYIITNRITINSSFVVFNGNGCIMNSGNNSCFAIAANAHDLTFINVNFVENFIVDSDNESNYAIATISNSNSERYEAYNISIENCYFTGGVFGVSLNNAGNCIIKNCIFEEFVYKPNDLSGGYAILEQSCVNVAIENCIFKTGTYGRHSIYVSVKQTKTEYKYSENITINNCLFDNSKMQLQDTGAFYSTSTTAVVVRACRGFTMNNCELKKGTAIIALNDVDGYITGKIYNCYTYNSRFIPNTASAGESRTSFIANCNNNIESNIEFERIYTIDADTNFHDASLAGSTIKYGNTDVFSTIIINNCNYIEIHDLKLKTSDTLRYAGTNILRGKFKNIYADTYITFPRITSTGYVSFEMYEDANKTGFWISRDGSIRYDNKALIPITIAKATNGNTDDIVITFTSLNSRPKNITFTNMLNDHIKYYVLNISDSSLNDNQLRLAMFDIETKQRISDYYNTIVSF